MILGTEIPFKVVDPPKSRQRDKSLNTTEFNRKAKKRRAKAKFDAKGRKINRKKK